MNQTDSNFFAVLINYYAEHQRVLPWREAQKDGTINPYHVLVSELMLQQTQVERVIPKYDSFLKQFPTIESLARAQLSEVLDVWLGLGYNRRALYLLEAAKTLYKLEFPQTVDALVALKGISHNTAAAILTYAYNQKHSFVETNIRTVMIYTFFNDTFQVSDKEIEARLEQLLDTYEGSYREFYWAMMDYGTFLKKQGSNSHRKSKQYKKQASFAGSKRQLRGEILRRAAENQTVIKITHDIKDARLDQVLQELEKDGLIRVTDKRIEIA